MTPATGLLASAALAWVMLLVASLARSRGYTPAGLRVAFGNRDDLPEATAFAGRADRAAKNMLENLALFAATLLAALWAGVAAQKLTTPCAVFVAARVVYALLYWAGVAYLRTVAWAVAVGGVVWCAYAALVAAS